MGGGAGVWPLGLCCGCTGGSAASDDLGECMQQKKAQYTSPVRLRVGRSLGASVGLPWLVGIPSGRVTFGFGCRPRFSRFGFSSSETTPSRCTSVSILSRLCKATTSPLPLALSPTKLAA